MIRTEPVPVEPGDTPETLKARVQRVEHRILPEVVKELISRMTIRRALLSVYDKTGLADFARGLSGLGVELLASSGTAKALADERIPVTPLEQLTGFGDLLGHRVVTLHPAVHGGILARRDVPGDMAELRAHGIEPIDLVCVNLYPFERTVGRLDVAWEDVIGQIDVGGPALLRAAAKNHAHVVPVCRPEDYELLVEELRVRAEVTSATRRRLAARAFQRTAAYDAAVAGWLGRDDAFPETYVPVFERYMDLAYGENPHQRAAYYAQQGARTHLLARVDQLQGRPLSFNNLGDLSAGRLLAARAGRAGRRDREAREPVRRRARRDGGRGVREGARRRPGLRLRRRRRR